MVAPPRLDRGVDLRGLFTDPTGTARSVNIMGRGGSRKNFYDGRGHMALHLPDEAAGVLEGARLAHVHLANWAREALPMARELGVAISCDLQDVTDPDDPYRGDFVRAAQVLFCSAANHSGADALASALLTANPGALVVIGMGADGCAVADAHGLERFAPPASDLPIVDTNGAGDLLAVGFLSAHVLDGLGVAEAVDRGQRAARWCCTQKATTDHLLPPDVPINRADQLS